MQVGKNVLLSLNILLYIKSHKKYLLTISTPFPYTALRMHKMSERGRKSMSTI